MQLSDGLCSPSQLSALPMVCTKYDRTPEAFREPARTTTDGETLPVSWMFGNILPTMMSSVEIRALGINCVSETGCILYSRGTCSGLRNSLGQVAEPKQGSDLIQI